MTADTTASFGFRDVPEAQKEGLVREVFSSVASKYDLMNDLMSAGVHRLWKDAFVEWLNPASRLARARRRRRHRRRRLSHRGGGAGRAAARRRLWSATSMADMVGEGVRRARGQGERAIEWITGDAEALPIPDASMDAYTIAFGIRNVTHIDKALAEARRVLKPGGRFLCLEFSRSMRPASMRCTTPIR